MLNITCVLLLPWLLSSTYMICKGKSVCSLWNAPLIVLYLALYLRSRHIKFTCSSPQRPALRARDTPCTTLYPLAPTNPYSSISNMYGADRKRHELSLESDSENELRPTKLLKLKSTTHVFTQNRATNPTGGTKSDPENPTSTQGTVEAVDSHPRDDNSHNDPSYARGWEDSSGTCHSLEDSGVEHHDLFRSR